MCVSSMDEFLKGLKRVQLACEALVKNWDEYAKNRQTANRSGLSQKHTSTGLEDTGTRHH